MKKLLLLTLILASANTLLANIRLPAMVGDNMVLQRDSPIKLWGWADNGEKISIQFQGKWFTTESDKNGHWSLQLLTYPAGGPYNMNIKGSNRLTIKNILIGDVWLASGQSNMEWIMENIDNATTEIKASNYPSIRLITVKKTFSFRPLSNIITTGWNECSPETVKDFSAVAFLFGRSLYNRYKVPIGLISSSWGGTAAQAWISLSGLKKFPEFGKMAANYSTISQSEYDTFKSKKMTWISEHSEEDRGRANGQSSWAAVNTDISDWSPITVPNQGPLKGYGSAVWLRKELDLPAFAAGKSIDINLGAIQSSDSTFFNGQFIGSSTAFSKRMYTVASNLVKAGRNTLVLRVRGAGELSGIYGPPDDFFVKIDELRLPLPGQWLYKTGPDLTGMPDHPELSNFLEAFPANPALLYNAMIAPLTSLKIKGVIWYQGESNAADMDAANQYYSLFPTLIKDWRQTWGYDFPFLFVQLAGFQANKSEPADYAWAHLREAQAKALSLPNTGMATAIDIGDEKDIHPGNKQDVAKRLALVAQNVVYGENIVSTGPILKSMKAEGNSIRLTFKSIGNGLWIRDKYGYLRGFAVAGLDKKFVWAKAFQDGNDILVRASSVRKPVAVRYDWSNTPDGNLYNQEKLPTAPFRTDDW